MELRGRNRWRRTLFLEGWMWMEGKGRVLSEIGVRMGAVKDSGDSGYLRDLGPLYPSSHPDSQSSTQEGPVSHLSAAPRCPRDPSLEPPKGTPKAGRGLRVPLGRFSLSWGSSCWALRVNSHHHTCLINV